MTKNQESKNNENEKYESTLYLPCNKKYKLQEKEQHKKTKKSNQTNNIIITFYFLLIEIV